MNRRVLWAIGWSKGTQNAQSWDNIKSVNCISWSSWILRGKLNTLLTAALVSVRKMWFQNKFHPLPNHKNNTTETHSVFFIRTTYWTSQKCTYDTFWEGWHYTTKELTPTRVRQLAVIIIGLENHSEKSKMKFISHSPLVINGNFSKMYEECIWSLLSHTRQILTQLLPSHLIWTHLFSCMKLDQPLSLNTQPLNCGWKYPQGKADALVIDRNPWNAVCSKETKPELS